MSGIPGVDVAAIVALAINNADWETADDGAPDASKCAIFIGAVSKALIAVAKRQQEGGLNRTNEVEFDQERWQRQLDYARSWHSANRSESNLSESRVRHLGIGAWR